MIKMLFTVTVLGSVGSLGGVAMAQDKQGETFGKDVSSMCAHRRIMPPDPRDGCVRELRSDAQLGYGQISPSASQTSGVGPGNAVGQGKGRR